MVILDGDAEGLEQAVELVIANPNPAHLAEDRIIYGRDRGIEAMLDDSFAVSAVAAYAMRNGEALVGGVTLDPAEGLLLRQIWLLSTAGATRSPRWLVREGRRMLASADRAIKRPFGYVQTIPSGYWEGVNYARHLGFELFRTEHMGECEVSVMRRMIP